MMTIGVRIGGACSREPLADFARWCKEAGFDALDLRKPDAEAFATVRAAGLAIGTCDLPGTNDLLSADDATRKAGIEKGIQTVNALADKGGDKLFCVFYPSDANQSRKTSFENWRLSFPVVVAEAEKRGVRIAVEGWPGPNNSALGVTPETLRAMFAAVPSEYFGINYDPSHLVRVGVDYKRFLDEFASRVIHVHGKDATISDEGLYLYGNVGTTFDKPPAYGEGDWRYTIPGEGDVHWPHVCARLNRAGYSGIISIELEDFRYNDGTVEGEKRGLIRSREHLLPLL